MFVAHMNAEQVERREHEQYDSDLYDIYWNADYTECDIVSLESRVEDRPDC